KYTPAELHALAEAAGYSVERTWTDADEMFSVYYLRVATYREPVALELSGR
ncbi:MAG: L-histidine N(alpha)-methyltransferase, partial [Gammaproteobacteria bacterium]